MSKFNKSNNPEKPLGRPGFKPSPPPTKQPQKLEVVKIISPKPPEADETKDSQDSKDSKESKEALDVKKVQPVVAQVAEQAEESVAETDTSEHLQPIPPATESMQYRAIGVIQGRYIPLEEQFSKGTLVSPDGTSIEAVLLGKTISIVKKRLDLEKDYLWVVYPRTRDKTGELHVQIAGVWAPVEMGKSDQPLDPGVQDGYFSIRGEIVYQSVEQNYITVKVQRIATKKDVDKSRTKFKLRLSGILPTNAVNHFWNINAQREGNSLTILDGQAIAQMPAKTGRKPSRKPNQQPSGGGKRPFKPKPKQGSDRNGVPGLSGGGTSAASGQGSGARPSAPTQRPSKPIIKKPKSTDGQ